LLLCAKFGILTDIQFQQFVSGVEIFYSSQCESTQTLCVELLENKLKSQNSSIQTPPSLSVFTLFQTNGKGQGSHKWISEPGKNLAYTIALPLPEKINLVDLNKSLTLSVCNLIQSFLEFQVSIKWPNDIFCSDKKVSGLLFQVQNIHHHKYLILGVGINVNQFNWPIELPNAASLLNFGAPNVDLFDLAHRLTENLMADFNSIYNSNISLAFQSKLYRLNQTIQLISSATNEINLVTLINVDELGRIVVENQEGQVFAFHHGQVHILL